MSFFETPPGDDIAWLGLGFVANHFDVVPVRTNDESCVVVRVVVRAQTRRTIVFATRLQSRAIESFDLLAILGRERQVRWRDEDGDGGDGGRWGQSSLVTHIVPSIGEEDWRRESMIPFLGAALSISSSS